jgi:hypothetical protein
MIDKQVADELRELGVKPDKCPFTDMFQLLPAKIRIDNYAYWLYIDRGPRFVTAGYKDINNESHYDTVFRHSDVTTAIAMLLIWAIKEGHVEGR